METRATLKTLLMTGLLVASPALAQSVPQDSVCEVKHTGLAELAKKVERNLSHAPEAVLAKKSCTPLGAQIRFTGELRYTGTEIQGGHVRETGQRLGNLQLTAAEVPQTGNPLSRDGSDASIRIWIEASQESLRKVSGVIDMTAIRVQASLYETQGGYPDSPYLRPYQGEICIEDLVMDLDVYQNTLLNGVVRLYTNIGGPVDLIF